MKTKRNIKKFFSRTIATNGNAGGKDESFSEGCWNLPLEAFIGMMLKMKEQQNLSAQSEGQFRVKFTLLDASKVGYKLIKSEEKDTILQERTDYSEHLDMIKDLIEQVKK